MKILCDVCHKEVASLFCPSDEAALCHACDRIIHHANKVADKHKRLSLHHPTSPLCDICQEKRAYVFCEEDRAILCRECDLCIHEVNQHTKKHNRFLFSGIKIGADVSSDGTATEVRTRSSSKINRPSSLSNENVSSSGTVGDNMACNTVSVSTSSISQYLIETIPGYCMEDLLNASFPSASNGFCKDYEQQLASQKQRVEPRMCCYPPQAWVPQFQDGSPQLPHIDSSVGVMEMPKAKAGEGYSNWICGYDYAAYEVPSISPPLIKKCKRFR